MIMQHSPQLDAHWRGLGLRPRAPPRFTAGSSEGCRPPPSLKQGNFPRRSSLWAVE
jgi:hypothetical protein